MGTIRIEYPDFPEEIQVAEKRRPHYFEKGDHLPKKYCAPQVPVGRYIYRKEGKGSTKRLYDWETKQYVVKNPQVASRPRFVSIGGNDIMRMHEHIRSKIVNALKEFFKTRLVLAVWEEGQRYLTPSQPLSQFPVRISMEIHTFPRFGNWDLSNLWIYAKCFEDAMQEVGMIPNDNIGYISKAAAPEFFPISREDERKMVFIISRESDERKLGHLFYYSTLIGPRPLPTELPTSPLDWHLVTPFESFSLVIVKTGTPGDLILNTDGEPSFQINVGKTEKLVGVEKALKRVSHQCIQLNKVPRVTRDVWSRLEPYFRTMFLDQGIPVYVTS